jgi:DNA invertase Pin-like site-specific DNA recombinase
LTENHRLLLFIEMRLNIDANVRFRTIGLQTPIYVDKISGAKRQRPELNKCLAALNADDALIVWKLDRLGRSLHDLITFLDDLKGRKIQFRSLTESIDTETPTGRAMWQMIGILAELERSLIQERTKAGRAAAQARGVKMGRKPKLTPQQIKHAKKRGKPCKRGKAA